MLVCADANLTRRKRSSNRLVIFASKNYFWIIVSLKNTWKLILFHKILAAAGFPRQFFRGTFSAAFSPFFSSPRLFFHWEKNRVKNLQNFPRNISCGKFFAEIVERQISRRNFDAVNFSQKICRRIFAARYLPRNFCRRKFSAAKLPPSFLTISKLLNKFWYFEVLQIEGNKD